MSVWVVITDLSYEEVEIHVAYKNFADVDKAKG